MAAAPTAEAAAITAAVGIIADGEICRTAARANRTLAAVAKCSRQPPNACRQSLDSLPAGIKKHFA